MNLTAIKNTAIGIVGKGKFVIQKYSPEILLGSGIVGVLSGTVLACKATMKVDEVMETYEEKVNKIEKASSLNLENYTDEDSKKDHLIAKTQLVIDFAKLYAPAVVCEIGGIVCICSSYGILKKRNLALVAAYSAVQEAFESYRKRVIEEFGEETDKLIKNGARKEKATVIGEDGKKKKQDVIVGYDEWTPSGYARFFDESNPYWVKNAEKNLIFLNLQQSYFNDLLNIRGHVFLNEVYERLGLPHTQAGSIVGWKKNCGDGYVDFGIYNAKNPSAVDFVNGYERNILLDFNVDGIIWNLI